MRNTRRLTKRIFQRGRGYWQPRYLMRRFPARRRK